MNMEITCLANIDLCWYRLHPDWTTCSTINRSNSLFILCTLPKFQRYYKCAGPYGPICGPRDSLGEFARAIYWCLRNTILKMNTPLESLHHLVINSDWSSRPPTPPWQHCKHLRLIKVNRSSSRLVKVYRKPFIQWGCLKCINMDKPWYTSHFWYGLINFD